LLTVQRDTLDLVLKGLVDAAEADESRAGEVMDAAAADRYLMLLGSFSEAGFTAETQERDMYLQAARQHVPIGARLLLKAHPASYGTKVRDIAQALGAHWDIELCRNDALPIEALRSLAGSRLVISFSYSSVSLLYLHGSAVVHAMTGDLIEQYFPPHIRAWMHESNVLYLEQFEAAKKLRQQQLAAGTVLQGGNR
jgi:hypothetical protein